jgi:hypothetical protein
MTPWEQWKKGFDAWEDATAKLFEGWLRSPALLEPSGLVLSAWMRARAMQERALAGWWAQIGLPTRRDQERTLHLMHELESRIMDLEERLREREAELADAARRQGERADDGEAERPRAERPRDARAAGGAS